MKCPHCDYEDGCAGTCCDHGEKGDFYEGTVVTRAHPRYPTQTESAKIYGCPNCGKTFLGGVYY